MSPDEAYQWLQEKLACGEMWAVDIIMRAYRTEFDANVQLRFNHNEVIEYAKKHRLPTNFPL